MPTGYTASIHDGVDIDFATFALRCARGMGAAIALRDAASDVLPTEGNVSFGSTYARKQRDETRSELARVMGLSAGEIVTEHEAELQRVLVANAEMEANRLAMRERYENMLEQVEAWEPPTDDHIGLKQFMVEQIVGSIEFDCRPFAHEVKLETSESWHAERIDRLTRDLARAQRRMEEDADRDAERAQWVRDLRESLDLEPEGATVQP